MRLADDTRGRVPFALLGVLLLLGSSTYAASIATRGPDVDRSVEATVDRASAAASTAMRAAVRRAARDAARTPVTAPADTPTGDVLNRSTPFRDSLRLRIYVAAREELRRTEHRRNGVTAVAALAPTPNASALREAKRRVSVRSRANGTALDVSIRGVTVTARREGRVVARRTASPTVTVRTPILALHDRTATYQRRLDRSALAGPGLERRLTARLYPLVWARGYAQFGGLPLQNVLANRHVSVATNGALLDVQREVYGRSDPAARDGYRRAALRMGVSDLAAPYAPEATSLTSALLPEPTEPVSPPTTVRDAVSPRPNASSDRSLSVDVGGSADRAFVAVTEGRGSTPRLSSTLRNAYRVDARAVTALGSETGEHRPAPAAPGDGWSLVDERVTTDAAVEGSAPAPSPSIPEAARVLSRAGRRVRLDHTVVRTWANGEETTTTRATWSTTRPVGVALVADYRPPGRAPDRAVSPLFERGGALDGPNLRATPGRAADALDAAGGVDRAARLAAAGEATPNETLVGERPASLSPWITADLAALRDEVREYSVSVRADDVAAARANAAARLAERVRADRARLLDAPSRYDGASDRARVEARAAYLDALLSELDRRAARTERTNGAVGDALREAGIAPDRAVRARRASVGTAVDANAAPDVSLTPDGAPGYLTLDAVDGSRLRTVPDRYDYHPLVARNVNVFTVPYADATDHALDATLPDDAVPLSAAGRTLVAANRTLEASSNGTLRTRRDALLAEVRASNRFVARHAARVVTAETTLRRPEGRAAVRAAFARWSGNGARAVAASNGSVVPAVVAAVRNRTALNGTREAELTSRLRVGVAEAADRASVPKRPANRTSATTRRLLRGAVKRAATDAAGNATRTLGETRFEGVYGTVLAGMPVAPVPGYWYATVNAWTVSVRGRYPSFSVRTRRGSGVTPLTYVRDGSVAALDVDGDGERERLGRSERLSFDVETVVLVAVPAAGRGVGDVDGNADERSPGGRVPGCDLPNDRQCPRPHGPVPSN